MKIITTLLVLMGLSVLLFPGKLAQLTEISAPSRMAVDGDQLFIIEKQTVYLYSMKDFNLVKTFGKKGAGPGEFKFTPRLKVYPDYLLFDDIERILYFSRNGEYIKEKKVPFIYARFFKPLGDKFVGYKLFMDQESKKTTAAITMFDKDLKSIKDLATMERDYVRESGGKMILEGVRDYFGFRVYRERIFVPNTSKGFYIEVFNSSGKKIYEIKKEYEKMKVSEEYKKDYLKKMEEDPERRRMKDRIKVVFRDYFPAFKTIRITNDKLYVICYEKKDKNNLVIVMDLKGKILKKSFLPTDYQYSIHKDRFYYLVEGEDKELWELFVKDI
jgi:hypothetical protein